MSRSKNKARHGVHGPIGPQLGLPQRFKKGPSALALVGIQGMVGLGLAGKVWPGTVPSMQVNRMGATALHMAAKGSSICLGGFG